MQPGNILRPLNIKLKMICYRCLNVSPKYHGMLRRFMVQELIQRLVVKRNLLLLNCIYHMNDFCHIQWFLVIIDFCLTSNCKSIVCFYRGIIQLDKSRKLSERVLNLFHSGNVRIRIIFIKVFLVMWKYMSRREIKTRFYKSSYRSSLCCVCYILYNAVY